MKPLTPSESFPTSPEQVAAAIAKAPDRVHDPECSYDPNDPAAVEAFWKRRLLKEKNPR
jgi:hypothetical protein